MRVWFWRLWVHPPPHTPGDSMLYDVGSAFAPSHREALTIAKVSSCYARSGGHLEVVPLITKKAKGEQLQVTTGGKPLPLLKKNGGVR